MGRRSDNTGVPQTCPFIDEVIGFISSIEWDEGEEGLKQGANKVLQVLETIRTHNSNLRDCANSEYNRAEEVEAANEELKDEISDLKSEIRELTKELNQLSQD